MQSFGRELKNWQKS